jgi:hypothetical protein
MTPRVYGAHESPYRAGRDTGSMTNGRIRMKKVYLDNNIISAMGKDDMPSEQACGIAIISAMCDVEHVTLCTSAVTKEELDKWEGAKKPEVLQCYNRIPQVPRVERQELQGHTYADRGGTVLAWLMSADHPLWSKLLAVGLKSLDAHHLMVAILAECDVFLTYDKTSFTKSRRNRIAQEYPQIHIMWPSEALYCL